MSDEFFTNNESIDIYWNIINMCEAFDDANFNLSCKDRGLEIRLCIIGGESGVFMNRMMTRAARNSEVCGDKFTE